MSQQNPEDGSEFASAPSAGDVSLESLAELGASMILMRNVARELVSAIEHGRGALTSSWNALNYLGNSESAAGVVASSATGLANPLGLVEQVLGRATDAGGIVKASGDNGSGPGTPHASGSTGSTTTSAGGLGSENGESADPPSPPSVADADPPTSVVGLLNRPVADILGTNPLTDMVGKVIDTAAKPVGEGLRQAQRVAAGPVAGINDVLGKLVGTGARDETDALRKRGNALIRISYQPELQRRDVHPSFSHILDELLPDEARILRFLGVAGCQPMIDVRTKTLLQIGSVLLVGGVSVVASMAGCHWPDRDQHYFANLSRLGLVDLSREPVDDYRRYALLEVQPVALHAIENVPKAITIYRSITLTAFGRQFIDVCINTEGYNAGGWDTDGRQDKIRGQRTQDHGSQNRKQA